MKWTPLNFKKHSGKTLPQVMFKDPDWFFNAYEQGCFKNGQAHEAREIYRRSRSIRVPQINGQRMLVEYVTHKPNGKFGTMRLIAAEPGLTYLTVSGLIDFFRPRQHAQYDKLGYRNFIFALKGILFNDTSRYMSKQACEEFFNDDNKFDLAYATKKYPSRYDGLLVF